MTTTTLYPAYTQTKDPGTGITVEGNFTGDDTTKMTIDPEGTKHIMHLLSSLYSNPIPAVIREYTSNGLDAQAAAGIDAPVNMILPSDLKPVFQVIDRGTGMTPDDLRNIYSRYGKSTKSTDMAQLGAYGLGCKAAFAITPQFTVKTVKDGVQSVAIIKRGEDGVGELTIVGITKTDADNGTTVSIPVDDIRSFHTGAMEYAYYAKPGSIVIDTKDSFPSFYTAGVVESIDHLNTYYSIEHKRNGFTVVVGGAAYPVSFSSLRALDHGLNRITAYPNKVAVYSEIPIGSVDLVPSRDDIQYTTRTISFLKDLASAVYKEISKRILDAVTNASTRLEAIVAYNAVSGYGFSRDGIIVKWKDENIVYHDKYDSLDNIEVIIEAKSDRTIAEHFNSVPIIKNVEHVKCGTRKTYYLNLGNGLDDVARRTLIKKIRRQFLSMVRVDRETNRSLDTRLYIFIDEPSKWITEVETFEQVSLEDLEKASKKWRSIAAQKAAANKTTSTTSSSSGGAQKITYPVHSINKEGIVTRKDLTAAEISPDALYYAEITSRYGDNLNGMYYNIVNGRLSKNALDVRNLLGKSIVFVSNNRVDYALFKRMGVRRLPELRAYIDAAIKSNTKNLPPRILESLAIKYSLPYNSTISEYSVFFKIIVAHKDRIKDSKLVELAELWYASSAWDSMLHSTEIGGHLRAATTGNNTAVIAQVVGRKYPLLIPSRFSEYKNAEENLILYLNATHESTLKGNTNG